MNPISISAVTTYNEENIRAFQIAATKLMGAKRYKTLRIIYFLTGIILLSVGGYCTVQIIRGDNDILTILLSIISLYLGAQFMLMGFYYYKYFARKALRSIPANSRCNHYTFEENQLVISNKLRSGSYLYGKFGCVYETELYFLFFINSYNGYILEKAGITNGTAEELKIFLNERLENPIESHVS